MIDVGVVALDLSWRRRSSDRSRAGDPARAARRASSRRRPCSIPITCSRSGSSSRISSILLALALVLEMIALAPELPGHPLALVRGVGRVDRHDHGARGGDRVAGERPLDARVGQDADPIAGLDPEVDEAERELLDRLPGVGVGDLAATRRRPCDARRCLTRTAPPPNRAARRPSSRSGSMWCRSSGSSPLRHGLRERAHRKSCYPQSSHAQHRQRVLAAPSPGWECSSTPGRI